MPLSYDLQIILEELVLASSFGEDPPKRFGKDLPKSFGEAPKEGLCDTHFPHTCHVLAILGFYIDSDLVCSDTCDLVCPDTCDLVCSSTHSSARCLCYCWGRSTASGDPSILNILLQYMAHHKRFRPDAISKPSGTSSCSAPPARPRSRRGTGRSSFIICTQQEHI